MRKYLWGRNVLVSTTVSWQEATRLRALVVRSKNSGPGGTELEAGLFRDMRTVSGGQW